MVRIVPAPSAAAPQHGRAMPKGCDAVGCQPAPPSSASRAHAAGDSRPLLARLADHPDVPLSVGLFVVALVPRLLYLLWAPVFIGGDSPSTSSPSTTSSTRAVHPLAEAPAALSLAALRLGGDVRPGLRADDRVPAPARRHRRGADLRDRPARLGGDVVPSRVVGGWPRCWSPSPARRSAGSTS